MTKLVKRDHSNNSQKMRNYIDKVLLPKRKKRRNEKLTILVKRDHSNNSHRWMLNSKLIKEAKENNNKL